MDWPLHPHPTAYGLTPSPSPNSLWIDPFTLTQQPMDWPLHPHPTAYGLTPSPSPNSLWIDPFTLTQQPMDWPLHPHPTAYGLTPSPSPNSLWIDPFTLTQQPMDWPLHPHPTAYGLTPSPSQGLSVLPTLRSNPCPLHVHSHKLSSGHQMVLCGLVECTTTSVWIHCWNECSFPHLISIVIHHIKLLKHLGSDTATTQISDLILVHTISSRLKRTSSRRTMRKVATPSCEKNSCQDWTSTLDAW